jgi:autotransporter-associated beta strand protein
LTLTGDSHYSGGTTISGGKLQIGNSVQSGSIFGDITDDASFVYDRSDVVTYPSVISGTGDFTQKGTGTVVFTGTNTYTGGTIINTGGTLQLGNGGTTGIISNTGGIVDNGNITFDRTDSFTFGGYIHGNGSLTQSGTGTVTLSTSNNYLGNTNVTAGKLIISAVNGLAESPVSITGGVLQLAPGTGEEDITGITVTGSSDFDITNNHVFIDYGSGTDPIASVAALIASGYAGKTWTGSGIMSTTAQSNAGSYGIGYADSADPGNPAHLASGQIEVMYTRLGDANLDGVVNGIDFTILVGNLGKSVNSWDQGDFNYDGVVSGIDFTALVGNLGKAANGADVTLPAADLAAIDAFAAANGLMADVPEPASIGLIVLAGLAALAQRKRRQQIG